VNDNTSTRDNNNEQQERTVTPSWDNTNEQ